MTETDGASADSPRRRAKTLKQFGYDWNLSRPTIYRLAAQGRLRLTKINGATRILDVDEDAFAAALLQAR